MREAIDPRTAPDQSKEREGRTWAAVPSWAPAIALLALAASIAVFATVPRSVHIRALSDIGLISVLPWTTFLALGLLTLSYWLTLLYRPKQTWLLLVQLAVLIVMLYGISTFVEGTPRFGATWKHVGLTEYFIRGRPVDPSIDAYFSWPGFFVLNAFLDAAAGLQTPLNLVSWAPVAFNLLYLAPMLLIFRAFTRDDRLVWLSVWLFYVTNWIGQDYYSPQGLSYFSYLAILAILLTWFRRARPVSERVVSIPRGRIVMSVDRIWSESHLVAVELPPGIRAGLVPIMVLVYAATAASHQLTPIALLIAVSALVIAGRSSARRLPFLMGVLLVAWVAYMAQVFLQGHLSTLTSGLGHLGSSVGSNVGSRVQGSPGHLFIVRLRLLMTVAIWGVAALGVLRRVRHGVWDTTCVLLAAVPFVLLGLQSYGGEMALRIYLFSLPFMVFLAGALFLPRISFGRRWALALSLGGAGILSLVLTVGFLFARYGNERMDYFTPDEIAAVQKLYGVAPLGSTFWTIGEPSNEPWRESHYEQYVYTSISLDQSIPGGGPPPTSAHITIDPHRGTRTVSNLADIMWPESDKPSYLVLTRSQIMATHLLQNVSPQLYVQLERSLDSSDLFTRVISNRDAQIYRLRTE